jgi:hypothetical protein
MSCETDIRPTGETAGRFLRRAQPSHQATLGTICSARDQGLRRLGRGLVCLIEHQVDLGHREAGHLHLEVQIDEALQFDGEQFLVPTGIERSALAARQQNSFYNFE